MTAETTTIRIVTRPEVRVCCLSCEAEGHRRGTWVPLDEADGVVTDQAHRGRVVRLERGVDLHSDPDALQVLETRNLPVTGPLTAHQVTAWQAVYETIGEARWPALLAWVDAGVWVEGGDGLPSASDFEERYAGTWESFEEYAQQLAEEISLMADWPETAVGYFDWPKWIRDVRHGYTVVDVSDGPGAYIFRDL